MNPTTETDREARVRRVAAEADLAEAKAGCLWVLLGWVCLGCLALSLSLIHGAVRTGRYGWAGPLPRQRTSPPAVRFPSQRPIAVGE